MDSLSPPKPISKPPLKYGALELPSRFLLSPLAGYTNLPFRRVVRELGGVGLATTDLVNARGLLAGNRKSLSLIESCEEDSPLAVQIFGNDVVTMCDAAKFLEERDVDSIDINMGCPVERITKNGAGSALMCLPDETVLLVRSVVEAVCIPVTVKMRLGWDETRITAPQFAKEFEQAGVAGIAIHGRTRQQGFKGDVNRDGIRQVVDAIEHIPIIGNGDIRTVADAVRMFEETGCDGISIGRGALANPWIFRQLQAWENDGFYPPSGNFEERLQLLQKQFDYLQELRGTHSAIIQFRKMAHWYLKAMRVRAFLRNQFQQACSKEEFTVVLNEIAKEGPVRGTKTGILPEWQIPVPSGPMDRW